MFIALASYFVINACSRNELHKLWDDCFYSPEQRNRFRSQADTAAYLCPFQPSKVLKSMEILTNSSCPCTFPICVEQSIVLSADIPTPPSALYTALTSQKNCLKHTRLRLQRLKCFTWILTKALLDTRYNFLGEEIPARQQGAVQQGGAEAGSLEQVHGAGEESKGGLKENLDFIAVW